MQDCLAAFFAPEDITYKCPAEEAAAVEAAKAAKDFEPPKLERIGKAASPAGGGAASDTSAARKVIIGLYLFPCICRERSSMSKT